jgi:beta-aspartyl-peptidase (threonine type)
MRRGISDHILRAPVARDARPGYNENGFASHQQVRGDYFAQEKPRMALALIVHGGAGDIAPEGIEPHRRGVALAASRGWQVLKDGGSALDAVEAAIVTMEDDPAFDAGFGSYLNQDGIVEMDASIMDGRTLDAGAIAGVQHIKNPIRLARRVMASPLTLLIGSGAEAFAQQVGIPTIENADLRTREQIALWEECRKNPPPPKQAQYVPPSPDHLGDTVGCVAVDAHGTIAAGTSTGGTRFKPAGRVGDSPIIGAGVYADNLLGGASATGWGEAITRVVLSKYALDALSICQNPEDAARAAIEYLARRVGGTGGIIIADTSGRVGFSYNTVRMACAYIHEGMQQVVARC